MRLFKKKEVPEELPELAIEELSKKIESSLEEKRPEYKFPLLPKQTLQTFSMPQSQELKSPVQPLPTIQSQQLSIEKEQGFFRDLIKTVTEGADNLSKLDLWYKNELQGDIVFKMREYWEKQQPALLLKNISGELKTKLMEKTDKLHKMEKEWQEIYFSLLTKEEQIRKEEKDLKDSLSEFVNMCKKFNNRNKK